MDITEEDEMVFLIMQYEIWVWEPPVPNTKGRGIFAKYLGWNKGYETFWIRKIDGLYTLESDNGTGIFKGVLTRNHYCDGRSKWVTVIYEGTQLSWVEKVDFNQDDRVYKLHHFYDGKKEEFTIFDPREGTIKKVP